jgi:hypothetical protein
MINMVGLTGMDYLIQRYCDFMNSEFIGYIDGEYVFTDKFGDEIFLFQSDLRNIVKSF